MAIPISSLMGGSGTITTYTQTGVLATSQTVAVPAGTKRIEALLCGGGGAGGAAANNYGGGGFGGLQLFEIPIVGTTLDIVIGSGGTGVLGNVGNRGGTTTVGSAGTIYAATGGGGGGGQLKTWLLLLM